MKELKFLCGEGSQELLQVPNSLKAKDKLKYGNHLLKQNCSLSIEDMKSDIHPLKIGQIVCARTAGTPKIIDERNDIHKKRENLNIINLPNRNKDAEIAKDLVSKIIPSSQLIFRR